MERMSVITKELEKSQVIEKVSKGESRLNKAAKLLNISKSQSIRLKKKVRSGGGKGASLKFV